MGVVKLYVIRCQFCEDFTDGISAWETDGIETLDEMADSVRDLVGHLIDVHSEHIVTIAAQRKEQREEMNKAVSGITSAIMERLGVTATDTAFSIDPSGNSAVAGMRIPVPEGQSVMDFLKNTIGLDLSSIAVEEPVQQNGCVDPECADCRTYEDTIKDV